MPELVPDRTPGAAPERPLDPSLVDDLREVLLAATLYDERRRHEGGPPTDELRAAIDRLGAAVFAPGADQRERRAS
jgi:hypothetical protein